MTGSRTSRQLAACAFRRTNLVECHLLACCAHVNKMQEGGLHGHGLRGEAARPGGTREELVNGLSGHREKAPRAQKQKLMHKVTTTLLFMWWCCWWRWCARGWSWSWSWSWSPHSVFLRSLLFSVSFSVSSLVCCTRSRGLTFTSTRVLV